MLRSIKQLCSAKLSALDGDLGRVKDCYFDDQNWAVRYLVADTGPWLSGRKVLLTPHAFGRLVQTGNYLPVNLTREQIENSPSIDSHRQVTRKYEEEYYRYYGWPYYWLGDALWGGSSFPILDVTPLVLHGKPLTRANFTTKNSDAHLRSTQAVIGYHIQARDGKLGRIRDFMVNDRTWAISCLVIKIGHRFSGKHVQIPTSRVDRISDENSKVFVNLKAEITDKNTGNSLDPVGSTLLPRRASGQCRYLKEENSKSKVRHGPPGNRRRYHPPQR